MSKMEIGCGAPPELLEDWLFLLSHRNKTMIMESTKYEGLFKGSGTVRFIFGWCKKLNQPRGVKYIAIELFDSFIRLHLKELFDYVQNKVKLAERQEEWNDILNKVRNQLILRAISCLQIASKMCCHYKTISCQRARSILQESGHNYSSSNVLRSELRVLKTLDYKVNLPTPDLFLDLLLDILAYNVPEYIDEQFREICEQIIDLVYLERTTIYHLLFKATTGHGINQDSSFNEVTCDYMFLAVSVAAAAYYIQKAENDTMIQHLHTITTVPVGDIQTFSNILLQVVLAE